MKFARGLVAGAGLCLLTACPPPKETGPPKSVVLLFDLSESTKPEGARQIYVDVAKKVLSTMQPGDTLVCGMITDRSESELRLPINETFEVVQPKKDTKLMAQVARRKSLQRLETRIPELEEQIRKLVMEQREKILRTDILGSIAMSERVFRSYQNPKNVLVLVSDMVEDSPHLNLEREKMDGAAISKLVEREVGEGHLPDLRGVRIFVVGANHKDQARFRSIRDFWFAYFTRIGAEISPERYGPTLIRFEP